MAPKTWRRLCWMAERTDSDRSSALLSSKALRHARAAILKHADARFSSTGSVQLPARTSRCSDANSMRSYDTSALGRSKECMRQTSRPLQHAIEPEGTRGAHMCRRRNELLQARVRVCCLQIGAALVPLASGIKRSPSSDADP
jgi:hypothetical protein